MRTTNAMHSRGPGFILAHARLPDRAERALRPSVIIAATVVVRGLNEAAPDTPHLGWKFALVGGGIKEPGWLNTQLSTSRLAVVPGYSHYNFIASPEVPQIVDKFLADPLTNPSTGAAAASQVS